MISLQPYHSFSLPSSCQSLTHITDPEQLRTTEFLAPFLVVGEGSNTVFVEDFYGSVIKMATKGVSVIEQADAWHVQVQAGENWHELVLNLLAQGVYGLENLALIPGTVGAAPVQNIGAYGVEVAEYISQVKGYDIDKSDFISLTNQACEFAYRDSVFKHGLKNRFVITEVSFVFPKNWQPRLTYGPLQSLSADASAHMVCEKVIEIRQSKLPDPKELPNSGSFFKNPIVEKQQVQKLLEYFPNMPNYPVDTKYSKLASGWLIEQAGLKGYVQAGIGVYDKQALVLVNTGEGLGSTLKAMIGRIQQQVWNKFSVRLEHEVRVIGARGELTIQEVTDE